MNQSFEKSSAYANRMKVFNNQLRLLKEKYLEKNTHFTQGHQFTIDLHLINHCIALKNLNKQKYSFVRRLPNSCTNRKHRYFL